MGQRAADSAAPPAIVIAGGGTGGHLYPGIAVAREYLRRFPQAAVSFAGTARGLEARVVPHEGFALDLIRSAGLKGKSWGARVRGASLVVPSMLEAWRVISRRKPSVVVGVGGYSSGPIVLMAAIRGVPTMVLEQNAVPGLTNRLLARVVRRAAVTYDETLPFFRGKAVVTGNPVRAEFFSTPSGTGPRASARVLILGGSQGAHVINLALVAAAAELVRERPDLELVHQTGERDRDGVRREYANAGIRARAEALLDPVAAEVMAADLIVCRAGATTLAELAAAGKPAVLVPLAAATDDHQRKNARVLVDGGAAEMVEEKDLTGDRVAAVVGRLLGDRSRLEAMAHAMRGFAKPNAAADIVTLVATLARVPDASAGGR